MKYHKSLLHYATPVAVALAVAVAVAVAVFFQISEYSIIISNYST